MSKEYAKGFYASEAWHRCRLGYIRHRRSVDGGMCEECRENPGYIVHHKRHITPRNINDASVTLAFDNLAYVCKNCHDKIHGHFGRDAGCNRKIIFDKDGNPIPAETPPIAG